MADPGTVWEIEVQAIRLYQQVIKRVRSDRDFVIHVTFPGTGRVAYPEQTLLSVYFLQTRVSSMARHDWVKANSQ